MSQVQGCQLRSIWPLVSGIYLICQLCVATSVVKEIRNQLVIVKDQDKTTSRGLVLRPSRRQSENEKRGDGEKEHVTLVGVEAPIEQSAGVIVCL
jgi:hypothetical protein